MKRISIDPGSHCRFIACCLTLSILFAACTKPENKSTVAPSASSNESPNASQNEGPPADVVKVSASLTELTAGGNGDAIVTVNIAPGYHINGNPSSKYQIETALDVGSSGGITAGKVSYPAGQLKQFSFSPDPIMVYEKEVVIKQQLHVAADAEKGNRALLAKLKVQPCDDTVCYPPRTMAVSIPINVK